MYYRAILSRTYVLLLFTTFSLSTNPARLNNLLMQVEACLETFVLYATAPGAAGFLTNGCDGSSSLDWPSAVSLLSLERSFKLFFVR